MTLNDIRLSVGRKCSLLDNAGNFIDGLLLEGDLTAMANERWRYLHLKYANKFPEALTIEVVRDLVEDQSLYEIDTASGSEIDLSYVGIKYRDDEDYYKRVLPRGYKSLNKLDLDPRRFHMSRPFYYIARPEGIPHVTFEGGRAIYIVPTPDETITDGLFYRITELPPAMTGPTDTPYTLPTVMHDLIVDFMVADVWQVKRDWSNSNEALNRAAYNERRFFEEYQISSADEPVVWDTGKTFNPNLRRR